MMGTETAETRHGMSDLQVVSTPVLSEETVSVPQRPLTERDEGTRELGNNEFNSSDCGYEIQVELPGGYDKKEEESHEDSFGKDMSENSNMSLTLAEDTEEKRYLTLKYGQVNEKMNAIIEEVLEMPISQKYQDQVFKLLEKSQRMTRIDPTTLLHSSSLNVTLKRGLISKEIKINDFLSIHIIDVISYISTWLDKRALESLYQYRLNPESGSFHTGTGYKAIEYFNENPLALSWILHVDDANPKTIHFSIFWG
jgi:hypothetical protein